MVDFADGSFMSKQPEKADCKKNIHIWEYETPGFRCCKECCRLEIFTFRHGWNECKDNEKCNCPVCKELNKHAKR